VRALPLTLLVLPLAWALACGGRYERNSGGNDSNSGGKAPSGKAGSNASAGRPATGGGCGCDPRECGAGYVTVPNPDGCCYGCQLDLNACAEGQRQYVDFRAKLIQENVDRGCNVSEDCGTFEDLTGCSPTCAFAIPNNSRRGIDDRLYAFAEMTCNPDCPSPSIPPCAPRPAPTCVMGRCQ
jgi:hypothetical protein